MRSIKFGLLLQLLCFSTFLSASVVDHFETIKSDPNALYAFFKEMPKGGELHYHLAGSAYPEVMAALATHGHYCINPKTFAINATTPCDGVSAEKLNTDAELYNNTLRAWSMKDFVPGQESRHDHFFATFFKCGPIVADFRSQLLANMMQRAANQHELYMEIMMLPDNAKSASFAPLANKATSLANKQYALLADKDFQKNLLHTVAESKRILHDARQELGCDSSPQPAVCGLTIKFQYFVLREQPLDSIFSQALNSFAAAAQSDDTVGVNLVQAEDGIISLRDYHKQMEIFQFLHTAYPTVHIALHAGELNIQTAPPEDLRFHIHDAIMTGQAERIGHGVDIAQEDNATDLLNHMAEKHIPVEINLVSNRDILNVSGKNHPLRFYLAHHVPVVLSTDDEGVLRTDLTQQYVDAVISHQLDYPTIKTINRNALTYSFLPGKSLWADAVKQIRVPACQDLSSGICQQFIKENMKARLQWALETRLNAFEALHQQ